MDDAVFNMLMASVSRSQIDYLLSVYGYPEPKTQRCRQCSGAPYEPRAVACFSCNGEGEVFRVGVKVFPSTQAGYIAAAKAMVDQMRKDEVNGR